MGRRKISIAPIKDDRNRQVTFLKRKNGLFKKAYELGVLCSADVAIIVFNANGKLFEFHSGDLDQTLLRYSNYAGPAHEKRGPEDYLNQDLAARGKRGSGQSDEAEEEEESDEEKPHVAAGSSGVRVIPHVNKGKQALRSSIDRKTKMEEMGSSFDGDQRGDSLPGAASLFDLANGIDGGHGAHASTSNGFQALPSINLSGFGFMPPNTLPGMQQPQQSQQANGGQMMPQGFSSAPMPFPNFSAPGAQAPNYGFAMPGTAAWSGVLGQQQQAFPMANGSGVSASGVPAWFGMTDPNSAAFQSARDQLAQLPPMQLLQHLGGMSAQLSGGAWAGLGGNAASEAAMQALQAQQQLFQQQQQQQQHQQQQHQHQHQHPHQQHQHQQHQHEPQQPHAQPPPDRHDHHAHAQQPAERSYSAHEPSPRSQPAVLQPHRGSPSFHPTPAPMYGSPASMLPQATPGSSHHHTPSSYTAPPPDNHDHDIARPESSASFRSSHTSPAGRPPPRHQSSTDSYGYDRPKLQVAIPADADPNEHTKAGLVTAGGASILGAGFHQRDSHLRGQPLPEQEGVADVHENGVERTAFASELLPSPFYPGGPYAAAAAFAWPTTDGHQEVAAVMATGPDVRERQDSGLDGMRRESDDSGGAASNGSKGLDDLSQAAQALADVADEAGSSAIGPGRRERPDGEDGSPYDGQSKRRRV